MTSNVTQLFPQDLPAEQVIEARDAFEYELRSVSPYFETGDYKLSAHPSGAFWWTHNGEVFRVNIELEHLFTVPDEHETDDPE